MRFYHLFKNGIFALFAKRTIGVRMLLLNNDEVLLVKHTYQEGWYTIGGAVEPRESPKQAMLRELKEEVGVTLSSSLKLFSVYYSRKEHRDDYIIFYIGHGGIQEKASSPEIAEHKWFALDNLPADISPSTRRRIQEYFDEVEIRDQW
ncbi:MAG: NUDIX domain-containing protein [Legionella sp.]|nr:NUDIX domain-containing protein [Legionella sp.]